jgi:hypothetical protein
MRYFLLLSLLLMAAVSHAQSKVTVIKQVDGQTVEVQQYDKPITPAFNSFAETDTDGNGLIDRQEAREAGILAFSVADLDGDDGLDEQEYQAVADGATRLPSPE